MPTDRPLLILTGASRGIGAFLAGHYLAAGYRVVGVSRSAAPKEDENYRHFTVDVGDEDAVVRMAAAVDEEFGRLDAVINAAGAAVMNHLSLTPTATADRLLRTNFLGAFTLTREAAKLMQRRRFGRIVNLSSVAVPLAIEGEAAYAAGKAALEQFTRIAAKELAPLGITVNAVGPTPIPTGLIAGVPPDKIDSLVSRQAIPRLGEMRDVANVIDFFLRPESDFVTGQTIYLGGVW